MNRGALKGFAPAIGDYQGGTASGGSWGGNRGRLHNDEYRAFGNADGQHNWLCSPQAGVGGAGSVRLVNTNCQQGVGDLTFPGDLGMLFNAGSGTSLMQGAAAPYACAFNMSGRYRVSTSAGLIGMAAFENNTISDNTPGIAQTLIGIIGVTSTTAYIANGAACTLPSTITDINSLPIFGSSASGTLTATAFNNFKADGELSAGATITTWSRYAIADAVGSSGSPKLLTAGTGTVTNQYGLDMPILIAGATNNSGVRIGQGGQTLTAAVNSTGQIEIYQGTTVLNFASTKLPPAVHFGGTLSLSQSAAIFLNNLFSINPTIVNTLGSTVTFSTLGGMLFAPTFTANTQTVSSFTGIGISFSPTTSVTNAGTLSGGTLIAMQTAGTIGASTTVTLYQGISITAPTVTGTLTTFVGVDIAAVTGAGTNIGIRNASSLNQQGAFIATNNVVTVTSNAGTVAVTNYESTFTNSSAATMAITMAVTGATANQHAIVHILDATNVAETIGWTNTENSSVVVPTTSNGSTTLPLTVAFIFNGSTSKWRCVGVS